MTFSRFQRIAHAPAVLVSGLTLVAIGLLGAALVRAAGPPLRSPAPPQAVSGDHAQKMARGRELFKAKVRPVLIERCVKCHGGAKTRGGLDLTTRSALLKGGDNGAVVVPGKARDSRLYKFVAHLDMPAMPPREERLPRQQLAHLADWIDLGAPYDRPLLDRPERIVKKPLIVTDEDRNFWSFRPLRSAPPPSVRAVSWCATPIDRFVLAGLEAKALAPAAPADRRALLRRAYFGLIGLPPTPAEAEAFLADDRPDAYARLIDRLLASPHYGERWARHWLDLARFGESHGFEHDYDRLTAYPYRDFVVRALNQDLPYDTFVKWQIAGDELAPDDPLALTATGFLGAGVHSTQITISLVEKERYDELDDVVRTIGTAMLGLTIGCARCHDHKYDPIPTRDYYRLLSTFTTTVRTEVEVELDPAAARLARERHRVEQTALEAARQRYEREQLPARFERWLASRPSSAPSAWVLLEPRTAKSAGGATLTRLADGSFLASGKNAGVDTYTFVAQTPLEGIRAVRLEALAHPSMVRGGPGRAGNGNFALSDFRVTATPLPAGKKGGPAGPVKLVRPRATFEQRGLPVAAAIDGDRRSAWAVDPQFGKDHVAVFDTERPVGFPGGTALTFQLSFNNNAGHNIGRPRLAISTSAAPPLTDAPLPADVQLILARLAGAGGVRPTDAERAVLLRWFRTTDPGWRKLEQRVTAHRQAAPKKGTKALICSEGLKPIRLHSQGADFLEQTHFLKRGDPNQKDGVATQGFLQVLLRAPEGEKRWQQAPPPGWRTSYRRRALAGWITDVDHGAGRLLARVIVNRLWQHHFGRGLVATPSDFGQQGERPSHPELLDWLASELIANGWRLKPIHKLIMTSAAYRQGSAFDREKAKVDPENRLLWRRVPRRLEAEVIRDSLLAVSGQLDTRMFGPGTLDRKQKRRSIYFFVKRSQLIPMMMLFDAPDGLQGIEQRTTTTIAPQALLLMNNELVRDCADSFARHTARPGAELPATVRAAYVRALSRGPTGGELAEGVTFVREQAAAYRAEGKADGERLALADFCQVLLGLNELVYVD